jgi:hypothetical protein
VRQSPVWYLLDGAYVRHLNGDATNSATPGSVSGLEDLGGRLWHLAATSYIL